MRTSITDRNEYIECCKLFISNRHEFNTFKQHPVYIDVLEHFSQYRAKICIDVIKKRHLILSEKIKENDEQGSPSICYYGDSFFDGVSPSTIRYIKVLSDIHEFIDLNGMNIAEIGVGYGGQCKVINDYAKVKSYSLFDLPIVLKFTAKYLSKYKYDNLKFGEYLDNYDLVISNYAISECVINLNMDILPIIILVMNMVLIP
jgi:putative sugar O-methyltransferase